MADGTIQFFGGYFTLFTFCLRAFTTFYIQNNNKQTTATADWTIQNFGAHITITVQPRVIWVLDQFVFGIPTIPYQIGIYVQRL